MLKPILTVLSFGVLTACAEGAGGSGTSFAAMQNDAAGQDAAYGTVLPVGLVARICDAKGKSLGQRVERSRAGYDLYDSIPGSIGQRSFFVTGFADGCPRQFTAALALFGAPSSYEELHYGAAGKSLPYAATDKAYEQVKARVCGVRGRKPCGGKIARMDRSAVFISAYPRFGATATWSDILIYDNAVVAVAQKSSR